MNPGPVLRETFSRNDRLRKRREFEECYAFGVRVSGRHLQLFLLARRDAGACRIGISVGRRSGGSVVRNRLRRRIREIFRRSRQGLPAGLRIVVNIKPSAAGAEFSALAEDYSSALTRGLSRLSPRG